MPDTNPVSRAIGSAVTFGLAARYLIEAAAGNQQERSEAGSFGLVQAVLAHMYNLLKEDRQYDSEPSWPNAEQRGRAKRAISAWNRALWIGRESIGDKLHLATLSITDDNPLMFEGITLAALFGAVKLMCEDSCEDSGHFSVQVSVACTKHDLRLITENGVIGCLLLFAEYIESLRLSRLTDGVPLDPRDLNIGIRQACLALVVFSELLSSHKREDLTSNPELADQAVLQAARVSGLVIPSEMGGAFGLVLEAWPPTLAAALINTYSLFVRAPAPPP